MCVLYLGVMAAIYWGCIFMLKGEITERRRGRVAVGALIGTIFIFQAKAWFVERVPGSWLERSHYTTDVLVNLFPDGSDSQNYRVPASIEATYDETDDGENVVSYRVYRLHHLTFPNGRRLTFEDNAEPLRIGRKVSVRDDSGSWWKVELSRDLLRRPVTDRSSTPRK